jgi:hypothetical protein
VLVISAALLFTALQAAAQQKQGPQLPVKVPDVILTDLDRNPTGFSEYGAKHLMIFYVDPDAYRQNREFQAELEARQPELYSPMIQSYAVINLADTILPNSIVRTIADRRTKGQPSISLADPSHALSDAWELGDCNGKFCLLFVTAEGELVYFRSGVFSELDKSDFYDIVARYK